MDHQLMSSRQALVDEASPTGFASAERADRSSGLLPLLGIASWCGLVSGLLEVATLIVRKWAFDFNHLYWMSRHFIWLIPLINLLLFLFLGLACWVLCKIWPQRGRGIAMRCLGTFALLAPIWAASSRLYGPAGFLLAAGFSTRLVPVIEWHADGFVRLIRMSL